jgi:2-amino-4-hydroxy-6-hydroxymethyldihydropteridine diphosphokinase
LGPRTIDLDILLFDDIILDEAGLKIPHPFMHERDFVLRPLNEIAPDARHPLLKMSIRELFARLHGKAANSGIS